MIRRTTLVACLFLIALTEIRAQAPDSLLVGTVIAGIAVPAYPESTMKCAIATTLGDGVVITSATIAPFFGDWALWGVGTNGKSITVAYTLAKNGTQLYLVQGKRWDQCTGVDCAGCELLKDDKGRAYCNCFTPDNLSGHCSHTMGEGSGIIDSLLGCGT